MAVRFITAAVALLVLLPFVIFSDTFMMLIFTTVLALIAVYEMLGCIGLRRSFAVSIPAYILTAAVCLATRFFKSSETLFIAFSLVLYAFMVYLIIVSVFSKGKVPITDAAVAYVTTVYIIFGFAGMTLIRDLPNGMYIFLICFIVPWLNDAFAYLIGMRFGRHKLIPEVSPKKTWEGAIGGGVFGTLSLLIYGTVMGVLFEVTPRYPSLIVTGLIISVLGQCGDLIASHIKRHYGIKDYGTIFPGHGGVMDRFDSIIATVPFLYILCVMAQRLDISLFEVFF